MDSVVLTANPPDNRGTKEVHISWDIIYVAYFDKLGNNYGRHKQDDSKATDQELKMNRKHAVLQNSLTARFFKLIYLINNNFLRGFDMELTKVGATLNC